MLRRKKTVAEEEDANLLKLSSEFQHEECLMISEVKYLLDAAVVSAQQMNLQLPPSTAKTHQYVSTISKLHNIETIKQVKSLFPPKQFERFEIAQIVNLGCETAEEIRTLVPSLNRLDEEEVQKYLDEMHQLRKMQPTS